jgi:branched-subunit amino acid aminotransferase/4-amino-4-deoxychorismate lyase
MLKGITRKKVLALARDLLPTSERDLHLDELHTAREAFITSTSRHVVPVSHIDDHPIGDTAPGPVSEQLNAMLHQLVTSGK